MNNISRNIFIHSLSSKIILLLLSILNTVFINRYIGVEARGQYALIINWSNILQLVFTFGLGYSYTFFKKNEYNAIKEVIILLAVFQFVLYSTLTGIILFFVESLTLKYILVISTTLALNIQILFIGMSENLTERNKIIFKTSTFYTIGLGILFFFFEPNLYLVLIWTITKYILEIIFVLFGMKLYSVKVSGFKDTLTKILNVDLLFKILKVGLPVMLLSLLITFNYNIDILIINYYVDDYHLGIYGVSVTLASMLWIIPDAFKDVFFNRSTNKLDKRVMIRSLYINIFIILIIAILFVGIGRIGIELLYGKEYLESFGVTLILIIGIIPMIFYKLIHPYYLADGKHNLIIKYLLLSVIINIVLNITLLPFYGIIGAALATLVSYIICGLMFLYRFKKDYNIKLSDLKW